MASMASHLLILPLLVFSAIVSTNNAAPAATAPPAPLVRSTCSATSDYDLCVAVLLVDPSSSTADIRGLGAIVLAAAAANASATQAALAKTTTTASSRVSLIRACADKYGEAMVALVKAREAVGQALYGEALLDAGVASEYTAMCQMLFMTRRQAYPAKLAEREMGLDRLCAVASDIITLLISQT